MLQTFQHSGIYLYARHLLAAMCDLAAQDDSVRFTAFLPTNGASAAEALRDKRSLVLRRTHLLNDRRLWAAGGLLLALRAAKADILFLPAAQPVLPGNLPFATTIHDLSILRFPQQSPPWTAALTRASFSASVSHSRKLFAVSENTRQDILSTYGVPESSVEVIYPGIDRAHFNCEPVDSLVWGRLKSRLGIVRPYLLHHGTIQPRKNLTALIQAYSLLCKAHPNLDLDLVLAGPAGWGSAATARAAAQVSGKRSRVILTGQLPLTELAMLVKRAALVVIPSLYEGFCFPMVEAMACGVPCTTSNNSCFPEVSGGVLRYFDPTSAEDIAATICHVLEDSTEQSRIAEAGPKFATRYDWRNCAARTLECLAEVCSACYRPVLSTP